MRSLALGAATVIVLAASVGGCASPAALYSGTYGSPGPQVYSGTYGSPAQIVEPYVEPYYGGPYVNVAPGPYGNYVYVPVYRDPYPYGYDTSGVPFWRSELGWQPGWLGGAPANPCEPGQRMQNRC
jgi:hypothetical protein